MTKMWCVNVAYWYGDESPRDMLECSVKLFLSKEEAVDELNKIIANDWTTEVEVNGETKLLSDCRGMQQDEDSGKYSEWYYAEDGTLAWVQHGTAYAYKGWVLEVEV